MASAALKKPLNSSNQAGPSSSKGKINNPSNLKKNIETSSKQQVVVDTKNKSIPQKTIKSEEKGKAVAPKAPVQRAKREKKVYTLAGQKYDPPEEREPLRIFYESLSKQTPTSEMAEFWLMEHGMLSAERSKKAYEKKQRKQKQLRSGTPIKPPPPSSKPSASLSRLSASSSKPSAPSSKPAAPSSKPAAPSSKPSVSSSKPKPESSSRQKPVAKSVSDTKVKRRIVEDSDDEVIAAPKRRKV